MSDPNSVMHLVASVEGLAQRTTMQPDLAAGVQRAILLACLDQLDLIATATVEDSPDTDQVAGARLRVARQIKNIRNRPVPGEDLTAIR